MYFCLLNTNALSKFAYHSARINKHLIENLFIILHFLNFILLFYLTCSNYIFYVFLSVKFEKHNKYVDCTVTLHCLIFFCCIKYGCRFNHRMHRLDHCMIKESIYCRFEKGIIIGCYTIKIAKDRKGKATDLTLLFFSYS